MKNIEKKDVEMVARWMAFAYVRGQLEERGLKDQAVKDSLVHSEGLKISKNWELTATSLLSMLEKD